MFHVSLTHRGAPHPLWLVASGIATSRSSGWFVTLCAWDAGVILRYG